MTDYIYPFVGFLFCLPLILLAYCIVMGIANIRQVIHGLDMQIDEVFYDDDLLGVWKQ